MAEIRWLTEARNAELMATVHAAADVLDKERGPVERLIAADVLAKVARSLRLPVAVPEDAA